MRTPLVTITALAATLALTGSASAADRYAAPDGDAPPGVCALADPCSLSNAAEFAVDGDVVRVLDGTHVLADSLTLLDAGVTLVPAAAGTRPVITLDADANATIVVAAPLGAPVAIRGFAVVNASDVTDSDAHPAFQVGSAIRLQDTVARSRGRVITATVDDPGAHLIEDVRAEQVAGAKTAVTLSTGAVPQGTLTARRLAVAAATGGTAVRVTGDGAELVDSTAGGGAVGVFAGSGAVARRFTASGAERALQLDGPVVVTDAVATAQGPGAEAIRNPAAGAAELRNVTAVASGAGSIGIKATAGATTARNVIARGEQLDVDVTGGTLALDHSSFRTAVGITDAGANQSGDPRFADAAAGDFRLLAGSPAIDAGVADDVLGATDHAGASRFQGAAPDLGAHESVPVPGTQPVAPTTEPADDAAPSIGGLKASGKRRGAAKAAFSLGEPATVTVVLERRKAGKRKGGACVKPTRKLRKKAACTRFVAVATTVRKLPAGKATITVGKRLTAGGYRVRVTAKDAAGNASAPAKRTFRVARKAR